MENYYSNTRIRVVNGWLEVERSNDESATKSTTHIKLDRISHLTREGPFVSYDKNSELIEVWHVHIYTARPVDDKVIKHAITFIFHNESQAESFLISINDKIN